MLNKCAFIGNLGADVEIRTFANGNKVANLRLAVTEKWKKDGQPQEKTEWVQVEIFTEGLIRVAEQYLKKGSKVYIEGKLSTRKYQDQSGNDKYSTSIVLQGFNGTLVMLGGGQSNDTGQPSGGAPAGGMPDDEIPFNWEGRI